MIARILSLLIVALIAGSALAEPDPTPEPFAEYPCSLGTVIEVEDSTYIIQTDDGRVIGVPAQAAPTEENVESDIAADVLACAKRRKIAELYAIGRAGTLAIFGSLPIGVQAQFAPVLDASDAAAKTGDIAKAREIVSTCAVPEPLLAVQEALVAALDPFVEAAETVAEADTINEVEAVEFAIP